MVAVSGDLESMLRDEVRRGLMRRLERFLDLDRWGFQLVYVKPPEGPVIFESSKCRLYCRLNRERGGDEIAIYYGRLHAPNEDAIMEWNGERCFPWHNLGVRNVTEFLEGYSAAEAVERRRLKLDSPERIAFMKTDLGRTLRGPDWTVALHAYTWDRYGDRLFSLLDSREPKLWDEFRLFVKEYYRLRPEPENLSTEKLFGIPPWQIC